MVRATRCNYTYVPTSEEYMEALGAYGSSVLIIGGLITVGLYLLFFEQVFFTHVNAHRVFRRHIFWIASVYPLMSLMSVISLVVPRADNICTAVKVTYMSIGISHFTDLTQLMFGSEEVLLDTTNGERVKLNVSPICCCCFCLPSPPVSKFSLRLVILLSDQLPFTQALYYFLVLLLLSANNITLGSIEPTDASFYLSLFNLASFLSGVYALNILSYFSRGHLEHYSYRAKSFSMKTLILITNMQGLVFDILGNYNVFPCIPPYLPPQVYKQTAENSLYLLEMMVLGSYTFWHYHNRQFLQRPSRRVAGSSSVSDPRRRESGRGSRSSTSTQSTRVGSVVDEEGGLPDDTGSRGSGGGGGGDGRNRDGSACGDMDECGRGGDRSGSGGSSGGSSGGRSGGRSGGSGGSGGGSRDSNGHRDSSRGGRRGRYDGRGRDSSSGSSSSGDSRYGRGRRNGSSRQDSIEIRTISNSRSNEGRLDTHKNYSNISNSVSKNSPDSGVVMGSFESRSSSSNRQLCTAEDTRKIQSSGDSRFNRVECEKDNDEGNGWMDGRNMTTRAGVENRMNSTGTLISSRAIPSPRNSVEEGVDGTRDLKKGRLQSQVDQIASSYTPQVDQIAGSYTPQVDHIEGAYRPQVKAFTDPLEDGEIPSFVVTSGEGRAKFGRASHEEVPSIKTRQNKFKRVMLQNTHPFPLTDQLTDNFSARESIDDFASYC